MKLMWVSIKVWEDINFLSFFQRFFDMILSTFAISYSILIIIGVASISFNLYHVSIMVTQ